MAEWWRPIRDDTELSTFLEDKEGSVCAAKMLHQGNELLGYLRMDEQVAYFVHEAEVITKKKSEVLLLQHVADRFAWQPHCRGADLPPNAFHAGGFPERPLYLGRAQVQGHDSYGEVGQHGLKVVEKEGSVAEPEEFYILVIRGTNSNSTSPAYILEDPEGDKSPGLPNEATALTKTTACEE